MHLCARSSEAMSAALLSLLFLLRGPDPSWAFVPSSNRVSLPTGGAIRVPSNSVFFEKSSASSRLAASQTYRKVPTNPFYYGDKQENKLGNTQAPYNYGPSPTNFSRQPTKIVNVKEYIARTTEKLTKIAAKAPSLTELQDATEHLKREIEQKEASYNNIIAKLRADYEEAQRTMGTWKEHFESTTGALQARVDHAEQCLKISEASHKGQIDAIRREATQKEATSSEKIAWLADQLQQLKLKAHKEQLEANEAAQAARAELKAQLDDVQARLEAQSSATEAEREQANQYLEERRQVEQELSRLRYDFQSMTAELERRLSAEQNARAEERRQAEERLSAEREASRQKLEEAQQQLEYQKTAMLEDLKAKDIQLERTVKQIRQESEDSQQQLSKTIEKSNLELNHIKAAAKQRLEEEKEAAAELQADLQAQIAAKELEIRQKSEVAATQTQQTQVLSSEKERLERELDSLTSQHQSAVTYWQAQHDALQKDLDAEKREAAQLLHQEREEAHRKIEAAVKEAEETKMALETGLKEKEAAYYHRVNEMQESFSRKERELDVKLHLIGEEFQEFKFRSHAQLMGAKEAVREKEEELLAIVATKEKALEDQIAVTQKQSEKFDVLWKQRMDLEKDLSSLKHQYESAISSSEERYRSLEMSLRQQERTAEMMLQQSRMEAQAKLEEANREVEQHKEALQKGLLEKDYHNERILNQLRAESDAKERELKQMIEMTNTELEHIKAAAQQRLAEEKEEAKQREQTLLAEIEAKQQEIVHQNDEYLAQCAKVSELQVKRQDLEAELERANNNYNEAAADWIAQYAAMKEEHRQEQTESEELMALTEATAEKKVQDIMDQTKEIKLVMEQRLKDKDVECRAMIKKHQEEAAKKERELKERLDQMSTDFQNFKFEQHRSLLSEKEQAKEKEREFLAAIADKEKELQAQIELTKKHIAKESEFWEKRAELEKELSAMKSKHAAELSHWQGQCKSLQDNLQKEQASWSQKLVTKDEETRSLIAKAKAESQQFKDALEATRAETSEREGALREEVGHLASALEKLRSMFRHIPKKDDYEEDLRVSIREATTTQTPIFPGTTVQAPPTINTKLTP